MVKLPAFGPTAIGFGIAIVVGALWLRDHDKQVEANVLWEQRDRARADSVTSLVRQADSLRKAFRIDTVRFRVSLTRWDTVKAGIDTLRDSVFVPVDVVRTITAAADTVVRACRESLSACALVAAAESTRADLAERRMLDALKQRPSWFRRRASVTVGYGEVRLPDGTVHGGPAVVV